MNPRAGTYGLAGALGRYAYLWIGEGRSGGMHRQASAAIERYAPSDQRRQSGGMHCQDYTSVWRYAPTGQVGLSIAMHRQAGGGSRAVCTDGPAGAVGRYALTARVGQSGGMHRRPAGAVRQYAPTGLVGLSDMIARAEGNRTTQARFSKLF